MIICIIQARMGSSRTPGKVMREIHSYPMLNHVITKIKMCKNVDDIIVATTTNSEDDIIYDTCNKWKVKCYRGHPTNVLERYYDCVRDYIIENKIYISGNGFPGIVRITADCPLHCNEVIDEMIEIFRENDDFDYLSNVIKRTFPHGMDVEIFSYEALVKTYNNAKSDYDKEHVTPYMRSNCKCFNYEDNKDYSNIRITVDYPEDLELVGEYYKSFYANKKYHNYVFEDIISVYETSDDVRKLEKKIKVKYGLGVGARDRVGDEKK